MTTEKLFELLKRVKNVTSNIQAIYLQKMIF